MPQNPPKPTHIDVWKDAIGRAAQAKMLLRAAFDEYAKGLGPAPTSIQIGEAKLLRRLANEALKTAMRSTHLNDSTDAGKPG